MNRCPHCNRPLLMPQWKTCDDKDCRRKREKAKRDAKKNLSPVEVDKNLLT